MTRDEFRTTCVQRDGGECLVPWCSKTVTTDPEGPGEVHHIIERELWENGGYVPDNGACVCNEHHRFAEENYIPPQAFWMWLDIERPIIPDQYDTIDIDKWGEKMDVPPWKEHRSKIKYPSTGHLPFSPEWDGTRVDWGTIDEFLDVPLVITTKMDGGNAMLVKDEADPVRARNGKFAKHQSFDLLKKMYWEDDLYSKIPDHLQIFGEWLYAKHSIHYGCDCDEPCEDVGPELDSYFQVFGVFDVRYNVWLSWPMVERVAESLGFPTTPIISKETIEKEAVFYDRILNYGEQVVSDGHEGIVVRTIFPLHYGQFERRLGKYVREGHVQPGEKHWTRRPLVQNRRKS